MSETERSRAKAPEAARSAAGVALPAFCDRPGAGRSVRCTGSPFWGPILYSGMALAAASTPSVRIVGRRARAEAPRGSGAAMHGSRQTRLPVEAIEKTLDVLVVERQRLHEQHSGPAPLEAKSTGDLVLAT